MDAREPMGILAAKTGRWVTFEMAEAAARWVRGEQKAKPPPWIQMMGLASSLVEVRRMHSVGHSLPFKTFNVQVFGGDVQPGNGVCGQPPLTG